MCNVMMDRDKILKACHRADEYIVSKHRELIDLIENENADAIIAFLHIFLQPNNITEINDDIYIKEKEDIKKFKATLKPIFELCKLADIEDMVILNLDELKFIKRFIK